MFSDRGLVTANRNGSMESLPRLIRLPTFLLGQGRLLTRTRRDFVLFGVNSIPHRAGTSNVLDDLSIYQTMDTEPYIQWLPFPSQWNSRMTGRCQVLHETSIQLQLETGSPFRKLNIGLGTVLRYLNHLHKKRHGKAVTPTKWFRDQRTCSCRGIRNHEVALGRLRHWDWIAVGREDQRSPPRT